MKQQYSLMKFDPANGTPNPYPSHAQQWRDWHGGVAWLLNPGPEKGAMRATLEAMFSVC